MNRSTAINLAEEAVLHLLERPDALQRFLAASGVMPDTLIAEPLDEGTAQGALAFLMQDEELAQEFSIAMKLKPGALLHALHVLEGANG